MEDNIKKLKKKIKKALSSSYDQIQELRETYEQVFYSPHIPNNVDIEEKEFKQIKTDLLKPEITAYGRTILFVHGGSFIMGSRKAYRNFCASLANICSANLYLPEYRLAPEHPFPTALKDLYSVYAKIIEKEKAEPENLILAGDEAGAGLALSLICYLKNKKLPLPAMLVLISPWADLSCSNKNLKLNRKKDYMMSKESLLAAAKLYTDETNLENKLVSPLFSNLKNFPKTFIQCGGNEILLSDAKNLLQKFEEEGTDCKLDIYENMPHFFQALPDCFPQAHLAVEKIGREIEAFFNEN